MLVQGYRSSRGLLASPPLAQLSEGNSWWCCTGHVFQILSYCAFYSRHQGSLISTYYHIGISSQQHDANKKTCHRVRVIDHPQY